MGGGNDLIIVLTTVGVVAVVAIGIAAGIVMKAKRDNTNATPSSASRAVGGEGRSHMEDDKKDSSAPMTAVKTTTLPESMPLPAPVLADDLRDDSDIIPTSIPEDHTHSPARTAADEAEDTVVRPSPVGSARRLAWSPRASPKRDDDNGGALPHATATAAVADIDASIAADAASIVHSDGGDDGDETLSVGPRAGGYRSGAASPSQMGDLLMWPADGAADVRAELAAHAAMKQATALPHSPEPAK